MACIDRAQATPRRATASTALRRSIFARHPIQSEIVVPRAGTLCAVDIDHIQCTVQQQLSSESFSVLRKRDIQSIRTLAPFTAMQTENFEQLFDASYLQRFPSGVRLIEEGDAADMLHILLEGTVDLYATYKSRNSTIMLARPVTAFILAAVVRDGPYLMAARTIQPSRILMIPASVVRRLLQENNAFALAMIDELAFGFRRAIRSLKGQKLRQSTERIAAYLLDQRTAGDHITLPAEKGVIASYLGMSRESFSRGLQRLQESGAIVTGTELRVLDMERLRALAAPSQLMDDSGERNSGGD